MQPLETYLEQVTQKDIDHVVDALAHLAVFSDVRALTAIQNAFFHFDPEVREAATWAASENRDESLLDALISLMDDDDPAVRLSAVQALGKFAEKSHEEKIILAMLERQPEPQTEKAVQDIIRYAGTGMIPTLEAELSSLDKARRKRAIQLLPHLGDLGVMTLLTYLPNLDVWESIQSAKKLGKLDHPMLVDYFLDMLQDPELEKRRFAMTAVGSGRPSHKAIQAVGKVLLNDPDQEMRLDAAVYLKWVEDPIALNYFDQFDADKEKGTNGKWIREIILDTRIMISLHSRSTIEIIELLFVGEKHERPLACVELSRRDDPIAIPFLARALHTERVTDTKGNILVTLNDLEAVEAVQDILDFFTEKRTNSEDALALRTLGRLYHPKALVYLQYRASEPILNDIPAEREPIESAREAVVTLQTRMDFMRNAWFSLMDEKDEKRVFIALQLAMRGDGRGVDLLIRQFYKTKHKALRYQTLRALGVVRDVLMLPFLLKTLQEPDPRIIWHAVLAIGELPLVNAPAELGALIIDEDPLVRMAVLIAYRNLYDLTPMPLVLGRLDDSDPYVRAVALQTLGKYPFSDDWLPALDKCAFDESAWVRLETARLLLEEKVTPSRESLVHLLKDENEETRFFASKLANIYLDEDLRPALEVCASKPGYGKTNARRLLKRLDWEKWAKDPELLAQKKREAEQARRKKGYKTFLSILDSEAKRIHRGLVKEGWIRLMIVGIAGSNYVDWERLYTPLKAGERLGLKREPDNPHDELAVMVLDDNGEKLGYIPREDNQELAQKLDEGREVVTVVLEVNLESKHLKLCIGVFEKDENSETAG